MSGNYATISLNGRPSIFPVAAPAVRFKVTPNETWEYLLGIYDGDPGAATVNKHGTRWILASDQGAFLAGEIIMHQTLRGLPGTCKIGIWNNTGDFGDLVATDEEGNPIKRQGNLGGCFILDQMLYAEPDTQQRQGLSTFLQVGGAPDNLNQVDFYVGGGFNCKGLIPQRDLDEGGIAVAYASLSDKLSNA